MKKLIMIRQRNIKKINSLINKLNKLYIKQCYFFEYCHERSRIYFKNEIETRYEIDCLPEDEDGEYFYVITLNNEDCLCSSYIAQTYIENDVYKYFKLLYDIGERL